MANPPINFVDDDTAGLLCPSCGNQFLHHSRVHVYSRLEDDSPRGIRVVVSEGGASRTDIEMQRNPSRRRNGIRIEFWCEMCAAKPQLAIIQHKGQTVIAWEDEV